jgi:DNA-directed RNA polymerase subunit H
MSEFNVLMHELVPEHHVVPEGDEEALLKKLRITKEQLPKINRSDPAIATLQDIHGEIRGGRIIKIVRKSSTAGIATAYRLVQN